MRYEFKPLYYNKGIKLTKTEFIAIYGKLNTHLPFAETRKNSIKRPIKGVLYEKSNNGLYTVIADEHLINMIEMFIEVTFLE